jgi:hypothetical protein
LDVSFPVLDPGFLLVPAFQRRNLSAGFIGYPIFPDMIDDIGVEYTPFSRRLFAGYRLLEAIPNAPRPDATQEEPYDDTRVLLRDYNGYRILARGNIVLAFGRHEGDCSTITPEIVSDRLEDVLRQIDRHVRRKRR